jgi:dTDP-4-amino-4,6-dideoxygalactose transaminase
MEMKISFHRPFYDRRDEEAVLASLRSGKMVGDGEQTRSATERLARLAGVPHALLTPSCTHALELAMLVLNLKLGDEVIVPSFTFVSSTNCVLRAGGTVVFADILPDTLTLDPEDFRRRITPRTRAVLPVVYAGVSPDMGAILDIAREHGLTVIEDAAQGIGACYQGRPAGSVGDIGCYSFHETKNLSTGEGGAFLTRHHSFMERAEVIREKGTNRKQFLQGLVDKYTWVSIGSSYLPPDTVGALLGSQLTKLEEVHTARKAIHELYVAKFLPLEARGLLTLPKIPPDIQSNYHIFYVLLKDEETRNRAISFFRSKGIGTTFHYLPLHLSPMGRSLGYGPGAFPVTESASSRLLRLPIYPGLSERELQHITKTMWGFLEQ